ncbi:flagellar basal body protein FliL [Rhodobacteraceae bacterium SC52]|nr:flagellar basal body protein FliL [Rhodobacteraceae bacterium SC52]
MTDQSQDAPAASRKPLVLGVLGAAILGGAGFFLSSTGLIPNPLGGEGSDDLEGHRPSLQASSEIAFVPIEPLMISLTRTNPIRQLRLEAELEVSSEYEKDVAAMMPKILDVMNTYLRAIDLADIENPAVLLRTRMQLLRRIQVTVGEGKVKSLLITKFLIS